MSPQPKLSVIIPCRHGDKSIENTLASLSQAQDSEVLVVENGEPSEQLVQTCQDFGARHLATAGARGLRLYLGARAAKSDNLWFVHADAVLPENGVNTVIKILEEGASGGYFRFGLTGKKTPLKLFTEFCVAVRCRFGGIPYGDQGLFATKSAYFKVGGHAHIPLFEEVRLVRRLRKTGAFNCANVTIGVNPERWDAEGYLRRCIKNRLIVFAYWLGVSPWRLAKWYSKS